MSVKRGPEPAPDLGPPSLQDMTELAIEFAELAGLPLIMFDRQISARKYRHFLFDARGHQQMATMSVELIFEALIAAGEPSAIIFCPDTGSCRIISPSVLEL